MSSRLKHIVIFEGPDICGKTTSIENFKDFLKDKKKYEVYTPRFPNYNEYRGSEIRAHLDNFDFYDQFKKERPFSILADLDENSINMMLNKLDVIGNHLIKEIKERDSHIVLIDRFVMSQYVYDHCWIGVFKAAFDFEKCYKEEYIEKFKKRLAEFEEEIYDRARIVWRYFVHKICETFGEDVKITHIIFERSNYIKDIFNKQLSKGLRNYDAYDKMKLYQNLISEQFANLSNAENQRLWSVISCSSIRHINFDSIRAKVENENKNFNNLTEYGIQNYVTEEMNYTLADLICEEVARPKFEIEREE